MFSKLRYIVNRSSSKKEQFKLHRSLLGVKGGWWGQNSHMNSPFSNIIAVTVKINILDQILDKVRQSQQILLENVDKNKIKCCPFFSKTMGGGVEKNPVRSSISDRYYLYAKYEKNTSTIAIEHVL